MIGVGDCGEIGGIKIGRENRSTRRKPAPAPLCPYFFYYYYLVYEAIGTAATPGLLCQPRVIVKMIMEKQVECRLSGETEVIGENLPQSHFVHTFFIIAWFLRPLALRPLLAFCASLGW
jgi:hypothetical protein